MLAHGQAREATACRRGNGARFSPGTIGVSHNPNGQQERNGHGNRRTDGKDRRRTPGHGSPAHGAPTDMPGHAAAHIRPRTADPQRIAARIRQPDGVHGQQRHRRHLSTRRASKDRCFDCRDFGGGKYTRSCTEDLSAWRIRSNTASEVSGVQDGYLSSLRLFMQLFRRERNQTTRGVPLSGAAGGLSEYGFRASTETQPPGGTQKGARRPLAPPVFQ